MPATSHVFCNLKGGCGKSSLVFQIAAQYAEDRPEENVLVLDVTAFGDVSHLLLGGAKDDHAVKKVLAAARDETHAGEMMRHLARVYGVPAPGGGGGGTANGHGAVEPVTPVKAPNSIAMVTSIMRGATLEDTPKPKPKLVNLAERFGIQLDAEANPGLGLRNLTLIPSGTNNRQPCKGLIANDTAAIKAMAEGLREHLDALPGTWRVFVDTDGDLELSVTTKVALRACQTCVVPSPPYQLDLHRACKLLEELHGMKQPCAKLSLVILNGISALPGAAGSKQAFLPYCSNFKPHVTAMCKAVEQFADRLADAALATPALLAVVPAEGTPEERKLEILRRSITLMQDHGKPGFLGSDLGLPFCRIGAQKYEGVYGEYSMADTDSRRRIANLQMNVQEILGML